MERLVLNKWVLPTTATSISKNSNTIKITSNSESNKIPIANVQSNLAGKQYFVFNVNPSANNETSGYVNKQNFHQMKEDNPRSSFASFKIVPGRTVKATSEIPGSTVKSPNILSSVILKPPHQAKDNEGSTFEPLKIVPGGIVKSPYPAAYHPGRTFEALKTVPGGIVTAPLKTAGKKVNAEKNFLVLNVKPSGNPVEPLKKGKQKKTRKVKGQYRKNILKSIKLTAIECKNKSTMNKEWAESDINSNQQKNKTVTSSIVNQLIASYGLNSTIKEFHETPKTDQNTVFSETNSNSFNLCGETESQGHTMHGQIPEFENFANEKSNEAIRPLLQTNNGRAHNTNMAEIDSNQDDFFGSTDFTSEGLTHNQTGSVNVSVLNENDKVGSISTDNTMLILQELRAIKENQIELKKESDAVKRRQSYIMHFTKAIAHKLEDVIDSEVDAFTFPMRSLLNVQTMEKNLLQNRYSEKLTAMLKRRISSCANVVSNLIEMVFVPESLDFFNLRGTKGKPNFKTSRISKIFLKISKLSVSQYEAELAKVFRKMHMRLVREKGKKENIRHQDEEVMTDYEDENYVEDENIQNQNEEEIIDYENANYVGNEYLHDFE